MKNKLLFLSIFLSIVIKVEGQSDSIKALSIRSLDLISVFNPMMSTGNPAALSLNPDIEPGYLSLNYSGEQGNYHAAQQGTGLQNYFFNTAKYKRIHHANFYGLFSYAKSYENDVVYSDINDPYRDTPYMLIDTSGNLDNYDREFFNIVGQMSLPVLHDVFWGSSIKIRSGLSVQDRDPRPINKVLNIDLSEGLLYSKNRFKIGANALYSFYNEEIEVEVVKKNTYYSFQQLLGFDIYTYHVASSYYRFYKRHTYGGELQLSYNYGCFNTLLDAGLKYYEEKAVDGRLAGDGNWMIQKDDSELEGNEIEINSISSFCYNKSQHVFKVYGSKHWMIGAERIMKIEQVGDKDVDLWVDYWTEEKYAASLNTIGLDYSLILLKDKYIENFRLDLGARLHEKKQAYYMPFYSQSYLNRFIYVDAVKSFIVGRHLLTMEVGISMKQNLNAEYTFNENSFITEKILLPDFNYFTSDYVAESLKISYELDLDKIFNKYYLTAGFSSIVGNKQLKRQAINISTGVLF